MGFRHDPCGSAKSGQTPASIGTNACTVVVIYPNEHFGNVQEVEIVNEFRNALVMEELGSEKPEIRADEPLGFPAIGRPLLPAKSMSAGRDHPCENVNNVGACFFLDAGQQVERDKLTL